MQFILVDESQFDNFNVAEQHLSELIVTYRRIGLSYVTF